MEIADVMQRRRLIGLAGAKRCGKDTVAEMISKRMFEDTKLMRFADPIHQFARDWFGMTEENKENDIRWLTDEDAVGTSHRKVMQTLGTEWGRQMIHSDLWVRILQQRVVEHYKSNVVVLDVRFENEAQMIRSLGGKVWLIVRPSAVVNEFEHASERGIPSGYFDACIYNSGTLEELHKKVVETLESTT